MNFHENDYLSWYIPRIRPLSDAVNLHASGMPPLGPEFLQLPRGNPWTMAADFEAALAQWLGMTAEEVVFTPGATGGTLLALLTLARPGSEIVVDRPVYEPMLRQAFRLNPVRPVERRYEERWRLPLDRIKDVLTEQTSLIMLTEPGNPGGLASDRAEILELSEIGRQQGALLLINEVYRLFGQSPSYHGAADNIVVVNSLSKLFGAYWARLGWLSARPEQAAKLRRGHLNMGMGATPSAAVGLKVMEQAGDLLNTARLAANRGVAVVDTWVSRQPRFEWHRPEGAGFGALKLPGGSDDIAFAERLHEEKGVLTVPGSFFGAPGTLRISWLQEGGRLEEGLDRIADSDYLS